MNEFKDGLVSGICLCDAEYKVILLDIYDDFNKLKRINKRDVKNILHKYNQICLGKDFNTNLK